MIEILINSLFISIFTLGVYYISLKSWPFYFYRLFWYKVLRIKVDYDELIHKTELLHQLSKPIISCPPCMCSFYGLIILFVSDWSSNTIFSIERLFFYIICIFMASAINRVITQMI